ncbi:MAG: glutathione peroxidase [Sphaerochaetaceae bacterium]|nr:glutathione peroxidase [Sphaerochaetaceae bacterium]MDC7242537.1 glutathione peroxidase [Sphaerochaetaceae bacterium]MDC7250824.1 glutathione peroxidase [Sphaerochaetaceae bacterium]
MSIYDYKVEKIGDEIVSLEEYKGKVMLIVNTASKCGFTPQFEGLEKLYKEYKDSGLVILGFPCNQFANQDPASDEEIHSFCSLNYGVSFPMFKKVDVNGENEDPLYTFLKSQKKGAFGSKIKWNFTKFLVDKEGNVVKRYASNKKPESFEQDIKKYLEK